MMSKTLFSVDPAARTKTIHHFDEMTGVTHLETIQDVEPYLDRNKRLQNDASYKDRGKKMEFMHIATIPNNVIIMLKEKHGVDVFNKDDLPKLERLLSSREFMYLRTVDKI